jgi:hypothetical protein
MQPSNLVHCNSDEIVVLEEQEHDDYLSRQQSSMAPLHPEFREQAQGPNELHSKLVCNSPTLEAASNPVLLHSVTVRSVLERALDSDAGPVHERGNLQPCDTSTTLNMVSPPSRERQLSSAPDDEARMSTALAKYRLSYVDRLPYLPLFLQFQSTATLLTWKST